MSEYIELSSLPALIEGNKWIVKSIDLDGIRYIENIELLSLGEKDDNGYQVFTPDFIVRDMVDAIGKERVFDINKTILEPTSGDGAFTCRILEMRLERIFHGPKENRLQKAFVALSTIYSIEMDVDLITKQRNNVFTTFVAFLKKKKVELTPEQTLLLKAMVKSNFIWGCTITEEDGGLFGVIVAYKMEKDGPSNWPAPFYKWNIQPDLSFEVHEEEIEQ